MTRSLVTRLQDLLPYLTAQLHSCLAEAYMQDMIVLYLCEEIVDGVDEPHRSLHHVMVTALSFSGIQASSTTSV